MSSAGDGEDVKKKRSCAPTKSSRLAVMLFLTFGFFLVELIVGERSRSNALVADAFHMLSDVIALLVAFVSVYISGKPWHRNTFGYARAEVLGAMINAVFLMALCFTIVIDSAKVTASQTKLNSVTHSHNSSEITSFVINRW